MVAIFLLELNLKGSISRSGIGIDRCAVCVSFSTTTISPIMLDEISLAIKKWLLKAEVDLVMKVTKVEHQFFS